MKRTILLAMILVAICFSFAVEASDMECGQDDGLLYILDDPQQIDEIYVKIVETMENFPEGQIKGIPICEDTPGWRLLEEKIEKDGEKYDIWTYVVKAGAFLMIRKK